MANVMKGVQQIGKIQCRIPKDDDFGPKIPMKWNEKLREYIQLISFEVQVLFGEKGENLKFSIVLNGVPRASEWVDFSGR